MKNSENKPEAVSTFTPVPAAQTAKALRAVATPWQQEPASLFQQLSSTENGLSALQAAEYLRTEGANSLQEGEATSVLKIVAAQFKSVIIWVLLGAAVISGVLGDMIDFVVIVAIVLLNAVIGFYQEYKAEKSIAALKNMTAPQAKVKRDGQVIIIPAADIVVGDILVLEAGDLVAADARLLQAASLKITESALTGESESVEKQSNTLLAADAPLGDRNNMVFAGTSVANGTATALVVATAMNTELGQIARLIEDASSSEGTPLQQKLDSFGRILVWFSLAIVALLFMLGWWRGSPPLELVMSAVSLAVAAVPEGLPTIVTVALALGVVRMSRRSALIRKLPAVEILGSTSVICTDKTGTLTLGEMTVRALYVADQGFTLTGEGYAPQGEILLTNSPANVPDTAALNELATLLMGCNNAHLVEDDGQWKVVGDPTEGALLAAAHKVFNGQAGREPASFEQRLPRQHEIPFDSDRKRSSVIRRMEDGNVRAMVNGAPDVLLQACTRFHTARGVLPLTDADRARIQEENTILGQQALRVLGSAYRDLGQQLPADLTAAAIEQDLVFVGLSGMVDPPRVEAKVAVAKCVSAGIRVVMITGDHPHTALAIARDLAIATETDVVVAGPELDGISEEELVRRAPTIAVYARVTAAHKLRIVRAWKANGAVVAMTGDGVNDAPAIEGADIGIAMGRTGTEVTKQAADMVITDDNFATIVAAVEEGRGIYGNIRKTLQYLLAGNTGELVLMTLCVLMGLPAPLLPIHLLWINLVTDGLPALCLATDAIDSDVMKQRPRPRDEHIAANNFLGSMLLTGLLTAGVAFAVYFYSLQTGSEELARTKAFATLVFAELLRAFGARSETKVLWKISLRTNLLLAVVVLLVIGLQVWAHHNATLALFLKITFLSLEDCVLLLVISTIPSLVLELVKLWRNHRNELSPQQVISLW
ncbi:MAG TPA: cation-translocating P-type ATPase [Cellvibrio sp.]|nr:cation-translocating P-type ATPase [Cellvibrio sp.]